jgi:hypothetical protein
MTRFFREVRDIARDIAPPAIIILAPLFLAVPVILGLVTDSTRGQAPPTYRQQARPQVNTFDVVEARKFVLKDDRGRVRAEIGPNSAGTALGLRLYDRQGKLRVDVGVSEDESTAIVSLLDPAGADRASVVLDRDGSSVMVSGAGRMAGITAEDSGNAAFVAGRDGKDAVTLGVDRDGEPVGGR